MQELTLTISEAAERMEMSTKTVYDWIYKSKFVVVDSPMGKCIKISQQEANLIRERNVKRINKNNSKNLTELPSSSLESSKNALNSSQNFLDQEENSKDNSKNLTESKFSENAVMLAMMQQIKDLSSKIENYAKSEGKVEFLTDNLMTKEKDAEFYKNEYFRFKYENGQLTNLNKEIESKLTQLELELENTKKENAELKERINQLSNRGFLGIFKR